MLLQRIPYPKGFPQYNRAVVEVAIYEAEKVLDNTPKADVPTKYTWASGSVKEDASLCVEAIVLAFATVSVHAVFSGELALSRVEPMREEFLLGIIERVYKRFEVDDLPCNEEFRLAIEESVRASKGWKFHLEQVEELTKSGGLKVLEKPKRADPTEYKTEPTYISLMSSSVEQGDMIDDPVVAEVEQPEGQRAEPQEDWQKLDCKEPAKRREAVTQFQMRVLGETGQKPTRKQIYQRAGYQKSIFHHWQNCWEGETPNKKAHEAIVSVMTAQWVRAKTEGKFVVTFNNLNLFLIF